MESEDFERLKTEYQERAADVKNNSRYFLSNTAQLFGLQQRQKHVVKSLSQLGRFPLPEKNILEIGCGAGGVMREFTILGASHSNLFGADLLYDRVVEAQKELTGSNFLQANGVQLPFVSDLFDFALQYTAFSSVLDDGVKYVLAKEMLRVLKPEGAIIWYDFWTNPTNPQTRGIRKSEIRKLFPNCDVYFKKITLAPPLARLVVPISWTLALVLENMKIFNTHYLAIIRPQVE